MKRLSAVLCLLIFTTGCAATAARQGVYPAQGQDSAQQSQDAGDCDRLAHEKAGSMGAETSAAGGVVVGAAIGAVMGAILGAFIGAPGELAGFGAAMGAAAGGIGGLGGGAESNQQVFNANYRACLAARGYTVGN
jgi:hypothetical protein